MRNSINLKEYNIESTYHLNWRTDTDKNKFEKDLLNYKNIENIENIEKEKLSKGLLGLDSKSFKRIIYFNYSTNKGILFIEKREGNKSVIHLFSNKDELNNHLKCLEKIIKRNNILSRFIPITIYPIEDLYFNISGVSLQRKKRRIEMLKYLLNSLILFVAPIVTIYYNNILKWDLSPFEEKKAIALIIVYILILLINIFIILRGKHELEL